MYPNQVLVCSGARITELFKFSCMLTIVGFYQLSCRGTHQDSDQFVTSDEMTCYLVQGMPGVGGGGAGLGALDFLRNNPQVSFCELYACICICQEFDELEFL